MKLRIYMAALLSVALGAVACEKTEVDGYAAGEGGVVMNLANTRAVDMSGRTLADCTTSIYQKGTDAETSEPTETLIREYAPGKCPETIKLLAGSYFVKVQWGEHPAAAAFDKCFYEGSEDFTITAGQTAEVTVSCKPQSAAVGVEYASSIAEKLTGYAAVVALPGDNDPNTTDALTFTESETGYFTMPEGVTTLTWTFDATHPEKGEVRKSGEITGVEAGKSYKLTFRYSDDLPGYVSVDISVDDTTKDYNDVMVFSEDPGVDLTEQQDFTSETLPEGIDVIMKATAQNATVEKAFIYLDGGHAVSSASTRAGNEQPYWTWTVADGASDETIATAVLSDNKKELKITFLSRNVLTSATGKIEGGKTNYRFEVMDSNNSKADRTMSISIDGLCPISTKDYDLWANTVTLRAVSASGVPTFKLRQAGTTEWKTLTVTEPVAENEYTATFAAEWTGPDSNNSPNANGLTVYTPVKGTGVWAENTYEAAVEIDGHEYLTTFTPTVEQLIPNGDMSDTSCSCFTLNHGSFWDSGNLKAPVVGETWLCIPGEKSGLSCAHLTAGCPANLMLSAGNLFTGEFASSGLNGTVKFGKDYDWKARPTALHLKYHAKVGTVNQVKHKDASGKDPLTKDKDSDISVIYVAIVDWDVPHQVTSGTEAPTGMWSPDATTELGEKQKIIGYGIVRLSESTVGDDLKDMEIPIYYYDIETKPSKKYKIVISASTSYYGDYMCGCSTNELWVTDFKWVY